MTKFYHSFIKPIRVNLQQIMIIFTLVSYHFTSPLSKYRRTGLLDRSLGQETETGGKKCGIRRVIDPKSYIINDRNFATRGNEVAIL